jgi:hypothetical protein
LAREGTTNTALIRIRRFGETDTPLTVQYHIWGTAKNGLDYKEIPLTVTMPAGEPSADIVISALEDALKERIETVVIQLILPSPSPVPPPYVVGWPDVAAAVIVDRDVIRPGCRLLPGRLFHVCLPGLSGTGFRLEASENLEDWVEIASGVVIDEAVHFVDPEASKYPKRFYRVIPEPIVTEPE